jgi:hypothetical protein
MKEFKTSLANDDSKIEYDFLCYENTEPIDIGDKYIYFFCNVADVQICDSENIKLEINKHNRPKNHDIIDLVYGFWQNCYKIKSTNLNIDEFTKFKYI